MFFSLLIIQYLLFNKNQTQCSTIDGLENLSIHDYKNNDEIIKHIEELNEFFITLNNIFTDFRVKFKYIRMIYEVLPGPYCGLIRLMRRTLTLYQIAYISCHMDLNLKIKMLLSHRLIFLCFLLKMKNCFIQILIFQVLDAAIF